MADEMNEQWEECPSCHDNNLCGDEWHEVNRTIADLRTRLEAAERDAKNSEDMYIEMRNRYAGVKLHLLVAESLVAAMRTTLAHIGGLATRDTSNPDDDVMFLGAIKRHADAALTNSAASAQAHNDRIRREALEEAWVPVNERGDLPSPTTRVLMFVRGVGPRIGTVTQLFELPWYVAERDWMDERTMPLEVVAAYINLDAMPWYKPRAAAPTPTPTAQLQEREVKEGQAGWVNVTPTTKEGM